MTTKIKILLPIILLSFNCIAQQDTSKILHYIVKGSSTNYKIFPEDNYLFVECRNKIKITATGKNKISEVKITNGTITKTAIDSIYVITQLIPGTALLSIYETGKDGKKKVIMNKEYIVVDYPKLNYNGTRCDSVITRLMLNGGMLYAVYDKKLGRIDVAGFKMDILENGKITTDSTTGNRVSKKMRAYVYNLKEGSIVYIKDVKYYKADGTLKVEPIFRMFIGKDEEKPSAW